MIQLSAAKVKKTSCIGAFRARMLIKELILDIYGRPRYVPLIRAEYKLMMEVKGE